MATEELSFSNAIRGPAFFEKSPRKRLPTRSPNSSDSLIRVSSKKQVRLGETESNSSSSDGEEQEDEPKRDPANANAAPFSAPSLALALELHSAHVQRIMQTRSSHLPFPPSSRVPIPTQTRLLYC